MKCGEYMLKRMIFSAAVAAFALSAPVAKADYFLNQVQQCTSHLPAAERIHNIPSHWLAAIASTESGRYHKGLDLTVPWPWTINANGKGYWFESKEEAIAKVEELQAKGIKSIDVGCMQVNLYFHSQAFANLEQAFNPAHNIAYAAKFLSDNYDELKSWTKATAAYHSRTPSRGQSYYRKVYKRWQQVSERVNAIAYSGGAPDVSSRIKTARLISDYEAPSHRRMPDVVQTSRNKPVRLKAIRVADMHTGETRSNESPEVASIDDLFRSNDTTAHSSKKRPQTSFKERMQRGVLVIRPNQNAPQINNAEPVKLTARKANPNDVPSTEVSPAKGQFRAQRENKSYIEVSDRRGASRASQQKAVRFVF